MDVEEYVERSEGKVKDKFITPLQGSNLTICKPATIMDKFGRIMVWNLPNILSNIRMARVHFYWLRYVSIADDTNSRLTWTKRQGCFLHNSWEAWKSQETSGRGRTPFEMAPTLRAHWTLHPHGLPRPKMWVGPSSPYNSRELISMIDTWETGMCFQGLQTFSGGQGTVCPVVC